MNGVPIILSLRINDNQGDTDRQDVEAFVTPEGDVVFGDGGIVRNTESDRPENLREITRGQLQAGLVVVNEKILAIDSGTSIAAFCSSGTKAYSRQRLIEKKEELEQQLRKYKVRIKHA